MDYTDETIIQSIQYGRPDVEKVMQFLYDESDWKQSIHYFVRQNGGSAADADDVFQEGMRRFVSNIRNQNFEHRSALKTYLQGICRNIWLSQLRKQHNWRRVEVLLKEEKASADSPHKLLEQKELKEKVDGVFDLLPEACRQVLKMWTLGYSMREIAANAGYKSDGVVRKKKRLCLVKLMQALQDQPDLLQQLLNE